MSIAKSALSLSKTNYNSHPKNKTTVPKFLKKEEIQMLTHILTKKKNNCHYHFSTLASSLLNPLKAVKTFMNVQV